MLPEAESDYCEDLAEIYIENGDQDDVHMYKAIHLMDKGPGYNPPDDGDGTKYQCPQTGSHFEFLDMIRRLKRLQSLRGAIDQMVAEQLARIQQREAAALKLKEQKQ